MLRRLETYPAPAVEAAVAAALARDSPRLEILAAQQTQHRLALASGRQPSPTAAPGDVSSRPPGSLRRHQLLIWFPHLDTPPASTLSQSSVQGNPGAQEPHDQHGEDGLYP